MGIIEQIDNAHITVRIVQVSGCSSCKMAGHCNASESRKNLVDIYNATPHQYHVGDNVTVSADLKTGYRAVAWGFAIPLAILMVVIFGVRAMTGHDARAALLGLTALIPYYCTLYLLRNRFREKFTFQIIQNGSTNEL